MNKEYNEEVRLQSLKEFVDEYANEEELTSVDGVRATIDIIEEQLNNYKKLLNASPSEALECLNKIVESFNETTTGMYGLGEVVVANDLIYGFEKELNTIKQALLKAEQDKKKLNEIEKLTHLLYSERRKIGQEYVKWCKENNTVFNDETNMITWVLAIKLKEWLK